MTKKERLEDLGRLHVMLANILEDEIFDNTDSKHCYETWVHQNHDKLEDDHFGNKEPIGLDHIFRKIRYLNDKLHECLYIATGHDDD